MAIGRLSFPKKRLGVYWYSFQKYHLHNAGNDTHFTLRALLMLAAIAFERMELEDTQKARVSDLKSIALDPIDFDLLTPDQVRSAVNHIERRVERREAGLKLKQEDWWSDSEESWDMSLFGIDAET
jgi:hypothetical protein